MEQAEANAQNAKRPAFLQLVEHGDKTYQDVAADIDELDRTTAGLAFESIVARNELEKIAFISDDRGSEIPPPALIPGSEATTLKKRKNC